MIDELAATGFSTRVCCRLLGVSSPRNYKYRHRPISRPRMRRQWLTTGLIQEVHATSSGTYSSHRVHAELTRSMDVKVSEHLMAEVMHQAGLMGRPGPAKVKKLEA